MLKLLRRFMNTWYGRIAFSILLVGLAGFGVSNVIQNFGSNTVASVAGEDISMQDFQRAYNNELNAAAQQIGKMPTQEEAIQYGIPSIVLNQLSSDAVVNKLGADIGLGVSEDRLGKVLQKDPSFGNTLGAFDPDTFKQVLQSSGYTEAQYFDLQTKAARRDQLQQGLVGDVPVSKAALELVNRYSADTRTLDYFVLNPTSLASVPDPTDAELADYLKAHQSDFRTSETRTADILALSPEVIAPTEKVSEDDISAEFEKTKASRTTVEKRDIKQVVLATPEQEKAFTDGKAAGKTFDQLLADTGLKADDFGMLAKTGVTDPTLADAAFGLAANDYTVIEGVGGKRAITVSAIQPGTQQTLAEAHDAIKQQLATRMARDGYADLLDQIEELRAAFKPLPEIAQRFGFQVTTVPVTADGAPLAAVTGIADTDRQKVATAIFNATQGDLAPTVTLSSTSNVWFDLKKVDPARDQTLDEVKDKVAAAWTAQETDKAVSAEVTKVLGQLKAGTALDDIAVAENQIPQVSPPITRQGDPSGVIDRAVADAAFAGPVGYQGSAVNANGDHVIFQVTDVTGATGDASAAEQQFLEGSTRNGLYTDFVAGLRGETKMDINQQALEQIIGTPGTSQ